MKRLTLLPLVVLLALATFAPQAQAQNRLEDEPGYIDFVDVEGWFQAEPTIEVNIKGALLRLVAEASRFEDPELADLLHNLKAIQMRGFDLDWADMESVDARARDLGRKLEARGWDTVVRVRDDDERVHMYLKTDGEVIDGMVVMVVAPDEDGTIFVNIVGQIDPEQIGRIGRKFNISHLDDF